MADRWRLVPVLLLVLAGAGCTTPQKGKVIDRGAGFVPPKPPPLIRLARTGPRECAGLCPSYSVEIDVEGGVAYDGVVNVKTIGPAMGHMSPEALQQLRTLMAKARQATFPTKECACGCGKNTQRVDLTTWEKNAPKAVAYAEGCDLAPHAVRVLETAVDDLAGIDQWIGTIQQRRLCFKEQRDCTGFGTPAPPAPETPDGGR